MTERFKEIAEQAGYHPDIFEMCKPGMEKFAELIVRECIRIDILKWDSPPGDAIREHFGVSHNDEAV